MDSAFCPAGIAARPGTSAHRRWFFGLFARFGVLDDPAWHCRGSARSSPSWSGGKSAHNGAKVTMGLTRRIRLPAKALHAFQEGR